MRMNKYRIIFTFLLRLKDTFFLKNQKAKKLGPDTINKVKGMKKTPHNPNEFLNIYKIK